VDTLQSDADHKLRSALEFLRSSLSRKRRIGAKQLRKLKEASAGPALLDALRKEIKDPRTWETQYQLIMALGECCYTEALPFIEALAQQHFDATMVYVALGDAIVRLGRAFQDDAGPVLRLIQTGNNMLIDGALRAAAMLKMKPDQDSVNAIIAYINQQWPSDPPPSVGAPRFWVAVAAAGWNGPAVEAFLRSCLESPRTDVRSAAFAAQQKKYLHVSPL
jgi:HEAT repeat protein